MKDIFITILVLLLVSSCAKNKKNEDVSSISRNDTLYVVDIDNVTKEDYVKFSSFF